MVFRLAQISDTHLSPTKRHFVANFDRVAEHLRGRKPDLVLNSGDLALDGAELEADLVFARDLHDGIGLDWLAIPGNHDVGDDPTLPTRQPADAARLARFRQVIGPDRFVHDVPGWRLIGLNGLILGAATEHAEAQWAMLAEALAGAGTRSVALFLHKPLAEEALDDEAVNYWPVLPPARRRLRTLFGDRPPALIASGHLHQWRDRIADGLRQVWAPSVGFLVGDPWQLPYGSKLLGYVEHLLHADGTADTRLVTVERLELHDIGLLPEVYGPMTRLAA